MATVRAGSCPSASRPRRRAGARASIIASLIVTGRAYSSHVYHVRPTPEIWAASSRRSPGVFRLRYIGTAANGNKYRS